MKYIMDTHIWVWWNMNPKKLSENEIAIISSTEKYDEMLLSSISPWEFCKLLEKERLAVSCDPEEWIEQALDMAKLRLVPLSPKLAYKSTVLPQPFHNDPADQIIVATAREETATLITQDNRILNYRHVNIVG